MLKVRNGNPIHAISLIINKVAVTSYARHNHMFHFIVEALEMYTITKVSSLINTFYSVFGTMTQSIHSGRLEDIIYISISLKVKSTLPYYKFEK